MPTTTISEYTPIEQINRGLKTYFMPNIIKQINEETSPIFSALKKNVESVPGNAFVLTMKVGRHGGIGARDETGALPTAGARPRKQVSVESKNLFAQFEISDKLLTTSKDTRMSFAAEFTDQVKDMTADAADFVTRNFNTDHTGIFGTVGSVSGKTVTLTDDSLIDAFAPGQYLDFGAVAAGVFTPSVSGARIASVDYDNFALIFNNAITPVAGNKIVLSGDYGKEMTGLAEILTQNNTIYGVDRNVEKWFNPQFIDKKGDALNSIWIKKIMDAIKTRTGEKVDFIAMTPDMTTAYLQEREAIAMNVDYMQLNGGFRVAKYSDVPISEEPYFIPNAIGVFSMNTLRLAQACDWRWMGDGNPLTKKDGYPVYTGAMACYAEVLAEKPAALGLIKGIADAV